MASNVEMVVKRFIKAVLDGDDLRKLHSIVAMISKADLMGWTDSNRQDVLHYAVMAGNAEAVDFLLKMGYFAVPYEPQVNMYAHLAARLGFRAVMCTILQHRPEDFKVAHQPLVVSPELGTAGVFMARRRSSREPELVLPAVIGSQVFADGNASKETIPALVNPKPFSTVGLKRLSSPFKMPTVSRAGRLSLAEGAIPPRRAERSSEKCDERSFHYEALIGMTTTKLALMEKRRFSSPEDSGNFTVDAIRMKPQKNTPLDVAARSKHVDCVKALLDMFILRSHPEVGSKGYLTLAALANNLLSLKLLMEGQFALNVYLDTLCCLMKADGVNAHVILAKRQKDLGQMVCLMCSFMAPWHIKAAWEIFNYKHKKCSGEAHEAFKYKVEEALETQSKLIHSLRTITAWQVWKLCQRKAANVKRLPVANELKMRVLPLVLFHTLW